MLTSTPRSGKCNQYILIAANRLIELLVVEHLNLAWCLACPYFQSSLLSNEPSQAIQITSTIVVYWLFTLSVKPLQGWESLNAESLSEIFVSVSIDLGDDD